MLTLEIILQSSISIYDKKDYLNKTIAMLSLEDLNLLHIYFEEDMSLFILHDIANSSHHDKSSVCSFRHQS